MICIKDGSRWIVAVALSLVASLAPPPAGAQLATIGSADGDAGFRIETVKPFLDEDDFTFFSTTINLAAAIPVSDALSIDAELPFARAAIAEGTERSSRTLGNPYLGIRTRSADGGSGIRAGIRLPLMYESGDDDFASGVGAFSDFQRMERYLEEQMSFVAAGTYRRALSGDNRLALEAGTVITTGTGGGNDETDLWLTYGGAVGFPTGRLRVGVGVEGRLLATESDLNLGERSFHHLNIEGGWADGRVRPRVRIGIPVDDELGEFVNYTLGFGVDFGIE